jgi:ankyrin repeat protein
MEPIGSFQQDTSNHLPTSLPPIDAAKEYSTEKLKASLTQLPLEVRKAWANSQDERGKTPLAHAIESHSSTVNQLDTIKFLVNECGADVNLGDKDGWAPLYRASTGTRSEILQFLLENGADPKKANVDGSTPLHRSTQNGNIDDVKQLLAGGVDVNHINCFGTPLAYAAKSGNVDIATLLLDKKANPNLVKDPLDFTPVELAANNYKEDMRQYLLNNGGKAEIPLNSPVHTSLSKMTAEGNIETIINSLKQNEMDVYGRTAAHYCASLGRTDLLKQIPNEIHFDLADNKGRTPLHYAVMRGRTETVDHLINERNCAIDSKDKQGYAPLMWACQFSRIDIAKNLLSKAQESGHLTDLLAITDNFGWLAIHKAAEVGNKELVQMLHEEYKVPLDVATPNNETPLVKAKKTNSTDVINYILEKQTSSPVGGIKV